MVRQHQTSDVQLHIGESRDSGFDAFASPRNDTGNTDSIFKQPTRKKLEPVIASIHSSLRAKRSNPSSNREVMDCFAEFIIGRRFAPTRWLAMTAEQDSAISPHVLREVCHHHRPSAIRGRGECRAPDAPAASCALG
jgi:hypothetical protein